MRMCIVTKEKKPKKELMRLVRVDDQVRVDPRGKERGRGANISMKVAVFNEAAKKGLISNALKLKRKLSEEEIKKLRKEFEEAIEEKKFRTGNRRVVVRVKNGKVEKLRED